MYNLLFNLNNSSLPLTKVLLTKVNLYNLIFLNISPTLVKSNKKIYSLKKQQLTGNILKSVLFIYGRHLLITQNKKYYRSVTHVPGVKTLLLGLWATYPNKYFQTPKTFTKYLYLYYLHSLSFIVKYYI